MALSSCEAEYVSLASAAQEAVYLQGLLTIFCMMTLDTPVLLCGDNQGALALVSNPVAHKRSKHIETRHHFIRQLVEDKRIHLSSVSTKNKLADIIAKNLPKPAFNELSSQLFVIQPPQSSTGVLHNSYILHYPLLCLCYHWDGFQTIRQKMFRQNDGGGRFGKKNMPKRLGLKTFSETRYPVHARSPSPPQKPAPATITSRSPFPLGLCSCSTSLSKMGI